METARSGFDLGSYAAPPRAHTRDGAPRRVGLEIELANLSLEQALGIVHAELGGRIEVESRTRGAVRDTAFGTFKVEFDSPTLTERTYLRPLERLGLLESDSATAQLVEDGVLQLAAELVPLEIVTPPVPWNRLHELDVLWHALRRAGAEDTYSSILYAFGLHLNPELPDTETSVLVAYMRAFLLLADWVMDASRIDLARRLAPFIRPFPEAYRREVLAPDYAPDAVQFLDHYLEHNPTRNRPLDLLPLLVHLHGTGFLKRVENAPLVKPRPTFHYRLPNCELTSPGWTPAADWNRWVTIERLASDQALLQELCAAYLRTDDLPLRWQSGAWVEELRARLDLPG
jgi:hypothetical protein